MGLLTEVKYKSEHTGTEVLASCEIKNNDLIELADSDLVTGKVVSYSEESFMFETSNLMVPNFIMEGFGTGNLIIGLPVNFHAAFPKDVRKRVLKQFVEIISDPQRSAYLVDKFALDEEIMRLRQEERDNVADLIAGFFAAPLLEAYDVKLSFMRDDENNLFLHIETKPRVDMSTVFDEFIQAILYQNRLYKSKLGSEKMCFCPAETPIGAQLSSVIQILNDVSEEVRRMMANDLIGIFEKEFETFFEEYILEECRTTGVTIEGSKISYFKDICNPLGTTALIKDKTTGSYILGELKDETKFLPKEMSKEKYDQIFSSTTELELVAEIS